MALMLSLMKGITFHTRELKQDPRGLWRPALNPFGKRLSDCTFGVVGLGRIGTAATLRAKAFGMDVVMYDPYRENGAELAVGIRACIRWKIYLVSVTWSVCTCRCRRPRKS